ncbi:MAG: transaldolase [bacterium]|nr:transaldolase [bacterium]
MSNKLTQLFEAGVSPWIDNLNRATFSDGSLAKMIAEDGVRGQTSNPSIFQNSIAKGTIYDEEIAAMGKAGKNDEEIVWKLMSADVQTACDKFADLYEKSGGTDGFVSLEVNPLLAHDTEASLKQARELAALINRPNLMIKVPATIEGLPIVKALIAEGINVNVTLLFSVERYSQVIDAWMAGLEERASKGLSLKGINSVASFFVSRVDTEADKRMDKKIKEDASLADKYAKFRGKIAVANARLAYELFLKKVSGERWEKLKALGASVQRPLWASTGTKNKAYSDTIYVDELIGAECVNTMPDSTMAAFADHGKPAETLTAASFADAHKVLDEFAAAGFDLADITDNTLMTEGVDKFAVAYNELLAAVREKAAKLA